LPGAVSIWLRQLEEAAAAANSPVEDRYPAQVQDRLIYVIGVTRNRLAVTPVKARLKRDGSIGRTQHQFDVGRIGYGEIPQYIRPIDQQLLPELKAAGLLAHDSYAIAPSIRLPEGVALALLERIAATDRGRWGDVQGPVLTREKPQRGVLAWRDDAAGFQKLALEDETGALLEPLPISPFAYCNPRTGAFGPLETSAPGHLVTALVAAPPIPPDAAAIVADRLARLGGDAIPLPIRMRRETRDAGPPVPILTLFALDVRPDYRWAGNVSATRAPAIRLAFEYGGTVVAPADDKDIVRREADCVTTLRRDRKAEADALERQQAETVGAWRVDDLHEFRFGRDAMPDDLVFIDGDPAKASTQALEFMAATVPRLRAQGWRIAIDETWPYKLHEGPVAIRARLEGGAGSPDTDQADWFSVGLSLEADGEAIDLAPMLGSLLARLPVTAQGKLAPDFDLSEFLEDLILYQVLPSGKYAPFDAARLAPIAEAFIEAQGLMDGFHPAESDRLARLADALEGCGIPFTGGERIRALGRKLQSLCTRDDAPVPSGMTATLRPYQKTGFGWLCALVDTGFGGVLADDMGLGKTIQALALLARVHQNLATTHGPQEREVDAEASFSETCGTGGEPSLLIVPTSLVGTWKREAERFAPDLRVLVLHGADRHGEFDAISSHDLVITTYPLLHRDIARLETRSWRIVLLDEAQAVKNPAAAVAKHIRRLRSRSRIALTGTPLENNLEDIWALFDWLIPGLLGDRKSFKTKFRTPIEREGDQRAQALLNARLRAFLLRRTKEEVARDLPDKTEIVELVPLGGRQRALYEAIRLSMDKRVRDAIAAKGFAASRITILDALLKLRQVCCDPLLLEKVTESDTHRESRKPRNRIPLPSPVTTGHGSRGPLDSAKESAKRAHLLGMLEQLVAEGRRILVFSQFTTMLDIIAGDIRERGWEFAWLTGKTKRRDEVVSAFQSGTAPIFLISLKAGGVGLTLTAADTVILYDPWWNPAAERQAMDRTHRIGQTKKVFVYRLAAEGSVEERIMALQERKQAMADALFAGPEAGPLALDETQLMELFAPLGAGEA